MRTLKWRGLPRSERAMLILGWVLKGIILSILITSAFYQEWLWTFGSAAALFASFMPSMIERSFKITLPLEFDLFVTTFMILSYVLGTVRDFYEVFWWWDSGLHFMSGIFLSFLGFVIVYSLYETPSVGVKLSPFFVALFSFCFAVALGGIWEIFEFSMDHFLGLQMQNGSLVDTMWDLIMDTLSALLMSGVAYLYVASPDAKPIQRLMRKADEVK